MIDALLYSVADHIRANMNYGITDCDIEEDGKPPPRCGNFYVAVHGGKSRPGDANDRNLYELFGFSVTLTMRITVPADSIGDQMMARNVALVPLGQRQGFQHKVEQLRGFLHMNWKMTVLQGQNPNSANDNLAAWATGTVYGFCEPARWQGMDVPKMVGGEWFDSEEDVGMGMVCELRFDGAKRFQAQTASVGPFV